MYSSLLFSHLQAITGCLTTDTCISYLLLHSNNKFTGLIISLCLMILWVIWLFSQGSCMSSHTRLHLADGLPENRIRWGQLGAKACLPTQSFITGFGAPWSHENFQKDKIQSGSIFPSLGLHHICRCPMTRASHRAKPRITVGGLPKGMETIR